MFSNVGKSSLVFSIDLQCHVFVVPAELSQMMPVLHAALADGNMTAKKYLDEVRAQFEFFSLHFFC